MAEELLRSVVRRAQFSGNAPIRHELRHDLESFIIVILYALYRKVTENLQVSKRSESSADAVMREFNIIFGQGSTDRILSGRRQLYPADALIDRLVRGLRKFHAESEVHPLALFANSMAGLLDAANHGPRAPMAHDAQSVSAKREQSMPWVGHRSFYLDAGQVLDTINGAIEDIKQLGLNHQMPDLSVGSESEDEMEADTSEHEDGETLE
jgi:hypothetical protein